jgi:PTH1 family peptidyl-tRNA hydrolase
MAFLQKKPLVSSSLPLYTLGANKTVLIVGLGNPGKEYEQTRHNVGFAAIDDFAERNEFPGWVNKKDLKSHIAYQNLGSTRVILVKPTTFMNESGQALAAVQKFYKVYGQETVVVYDELALPFGQVRARVGGEAAGHNGVKSLIQHLGEDFGRLRIGISNDFSAKADAAEFVLGKFTKEEQGHLPDILKEVGVMLTEFIYSGELPHETRTVD